jgi:predicted GIY-YIG superfamily endonuclease
MPHFVNRQPFDPRYIQTVPRHPGVYVIYDLAGPIYVGRSGTDVRARLESHFSMRGSRIIASARRAGVTSSLMFSYCVPLSTQREVEAILMKEIGPIKFANLRQEALPEDYPLEWRRLKAEADRLPA